jgi:glutaredoxin
MMDKGLFYLLLVFCIFTSTLSMADIYKWTDANGKIHFSDKPPTHKNVETINEQQLTSRASSYTQAEIEKLPRSSSVFPNSLKLIMYTTTRCGYCAKARKYFAKQGIAFKEKNIETSQKYHREFKKIGGKGVPVILWGKTKMNGFSVERFEKIFKKST